MPYLWLTTFIWAFSFSLIGRYVAPNCDSYLTVLIRSGIAFLIFLPFLDFKITNLLKLKFITLGALQIGIMSIFYYNSFKYLTVSEVALFTIFTPFWVGFLYSIFTKTLSLRLFLGIFVCILGAFIIKFSSLSGEFWLGFTIIQGANLVFALGQVGYKFVCANQPNIAHRSVFGYFFLGAAIIGSVGFTLFGNHAKIPQDGTTWTILVYLGVVASGLGYFLWNKGACRVSGGMLAVMNNAVIPCAILVDVVIFSGKIANLTTFLLGSALMFSSLLFYKGQK